MMAYFFFFLKRHSAKTYCITVQYFEIIALRYIQIVEVLQMPQH